MVDADTHGYVYLDKQIIAVIKYFSANSEERGTHRVRNGDTPYKEWGHTFKYQ